MAPRKAAKKRKPIITLKRLALVFLIFATALAAYCVYLDNIVRSQFEGKRFALPARVYARPLEVFPGKTLALAELRRELDLLGFARVAQVRGPGEYLSAADYVILQSRPFEFWDGPQASQLVRVSFAGNVVEDVREE